MIVFRKRAFLGILLALCIGGCGSDRKASTRVPGREPVRVVVTTTLLESAVRQIGGNRVSVMTLMPPGSCPGHFDVSPKETKAVSESAIIFTHGYEGFVSRMLDSLGDDKPKLVPIKTDGSWMLPSIYAQGARRVANALCSIDPKHRASYLKSLAGLEADCKALETDLRKKLKAANVSGIEVLCSDMQYPLIEWMGFSVVGTYSRAEEFTPEMLHGLTRLGKRKHVRLVVDNLQSGPTAGAELAKDIGSVHVTLSSFPGGFAETDTWSKCLVDNVSRALKGVRGG